MSSQLAGLLEMGLVFGGVLGLLLWELYSVRRSLKRDAAAAAKPSTERNAD